MAFWCNATLVIHIENSQQCTFILLITGHNAIKMGGWEEKKLPDLLDRLDMARDILVLQISVTQDGVTIGNTS